MYLHINIKLCVLQKKVQINQWQKSEIYHAKRQLMREKVKICTVAGVLLYTNL